MAENLSKIKIGRRRVIYKGIDLGHTLGGSTLNVEREFQAMEVDKYGTTPVDFALTGVKAQITVRLAQVDHDVLRHAFPESFDYDGAGSLDRVDIGADAGTMLRAEAGPLVLHKPENVLTDDSEDWTLYKAVSTEPVELEFKVDEQQVVEVTFTALVDESYSAGRRLGHYGPAAVS